MNSNVFHELNIKSVEQSIEAQLMTAGGFYPIEWLIDNGYLAYDTYELWRTEKIELLDDALLINKKQLKEVIEMGMRYAESRQLVSEPDAYLSWKNAQKSLKASADATLNTYLSHRWVRKEVALPQMDLFMDNSIVVIENALCDALLSKRWDTAQQYLNKLYQQDSGNKLLNHYDTLLAYGQHIQSHIDEELDIIFQEITGLEKSILPLSSEALKTRSRDFLAPAWRRIARGLNSFPLTINGNEKLHPSYAQAQIPLWQDVIDSITATNEFYEDSYLLQRYATAQLHTRKRHAHILSWVLLFWLFDEEAVAILLDSPKNNIDNALFEAWQAYEDQDFDQPVNMFSCWLVIQAPQSLHAIKGHAMNLLIQHENELSDLCHLLIAHIEGQEELDLRIKLQHSNPSLLQMYLDKIVA